MKGEGKLMEGLKAGISRRSFFKGAVSVGAAAALYGCSKDDDESIIYAGSSSNAMPTPPAITEMVLPGTTAHNCGGRCLTKAYVKNGVIKRFTTDERPDIKIEDGDDMQYRACCRCRSYKGRLYHPGRLQYPLIQEGQRGDMSTFRRATWPEAIEKIAVKMKEVREKWGPQGFYCMYASGAIGWNHGNGMLNNVIKAYGGYLGTKYNYSSHQRNYIRQLNGGVLRTSRGSIIQTDNIILWGSHFTHTRNSRHWPMTQAKEKVKAKGGRVIYIGPTLEDANASYADEWIPIRPGTDGALAIGIMGEMLKQNLVDDALAKGAMYGFYPSKAYWVNKATGETFPADPYAADAVNADPADAAYADNEEYSFIKEVPVGESLSDYLKGTYTAVTGTDYVNYPYKKYIKDVKDAQWASAITGISADTIKDLAVNIYGKADHKVFTERSYGLQRQYNGIYTYHAIESLIVLSGHFGGYGEGLDYYSKSFDYNEFNPSYPGVSANVPGGLSASCTLWHELCTGAKRFADKDGDLINNLWQLEFDPATNTFAQDGDGNYIAKLDASGNPIKVTPKILFNIAGNMLMNQHMNSNNTKSWVTDKSLVEMIVVYDNFMTSSARYADIVLPGDMNWEREDIGWNDDDDEIMIFASKAINPPGDVRSIHYFGRELAKKLDQLGGTLPTDASIYDKVTFKDKAFSGGKNMTEEEILHHMWNRGNPRWSFEELRRQGIINVNRDGAERTEQKAARDRIRQGLPLRPNSDFGWVSVKGDCNKTGKFHAFASNVVWEFENRGMRYSNVAWQQPMIRDTENDPIAHPVALYIPLEQGFREAGLDFNLDPAAGAARSLLMLSTHSRFRSHSTHNENAWLRDLYKQVPTDDGSTKLANDYLEYANMPADPGQFKTAQGDLETVPNMGEGGYAPIYINKKDADLRGIKNGQKVEVYNTIGKVYAVAHVTEIVIPGVVILFQGSWYDPNSEGIDVGGNPNTLTPDLPSYVDHGNAQNAVAVQVKLAAK